MKSVILNDEQMLEINLFLIEYYKFKICQNGNACTEHDWCVGCNFDNYPDNTIEIAYKIIRKLKEGEEND